MSDDTNTGGGASIGGDARAGRDLIGRDQRIHGGDSQSIIIKLDEAHRGLSDVQSKLIEMAVDIQLLYNIGRERHALLLSLQNKIDTMGAAILLMAIGFLLFLFFQWPHR